MNKEEIMQECIRRFPKGSKVKAADNGIEFTVSRHYKNSSADWLIEDVYYYGDFTGGVLAVDEKYHCGFYLHKDGKYATLVEESKNKPEEAQQDERSVYVYTDKEDGMIYMTPKFDPHVGGHNIEEVLSKAEDNSVIYEARPVGVKKVYLEKV